MPNTNPVLLSSLFVGGSEVIATARETAASDEVLLAYHGSATPLAQAAVAAAWETQYGDPIEESLCHFQGYQTRSTPLAEAIGDLATEAWGIFDGTPANLTAEWMKTHYHEVFTILVQHLNAKMTRSRDLGVVEDHVQRLITRLIERDQLSPLLTKGENPKLSVLRVWAYQSACTELRRWGVDASLRASRSAKTSREVQQGKSWRVIQSAETAREAPHQLDVGGTEASPDLYDPAASTPEDIIARKSRVAMVRKALMRFGRADLIPVVDGLLAGQSMSELRDTFGTMADQLGSVIPSLRV